MVATTLGGALVGWALAATAWRGICAALASHLALVIASFALASQLADSTWFLGCLLLVPCLTIITALAVQPAAPLTRRALPAALIALCAPPTLLLSLQIGWWIVPVTWIVLPLVAAFVSARPMPHSAIKPHEQRCACATARAAYRRSRHRATEMLRTARKLA